MHFNLLLLCASTFSAALSVFHTDLGGKFVTKTPRFIDVYTNYRDLTKVLKSYQDFVPNFERSPAILHHGTSFPYAEKLSQSQVEDTDLDRIDFHYPSVEFSSQEKIGSDFGTDRPRDDERFVFLQSQKVAADDQDEGINRRPRLKTNGTKGHTYIQKIPKLDQNPSEVRNKYEEIDVSATSTKNRIQSLLKRYLTRLYSQKYNTTTSPNLSDLNLDAKTKYLDTDSIWSLKNKTVNKIKKIFSLFTIIQFNNTVCNATTTGGTYQGTCYTSSECTNMGGTAIGNCASGYGVCCVFKGTCGGSASQNCSYFESPNYPDYYPSDGGTVVPTTTTTTTTENPSPTPDPRLPWYFYRSGWARQSDNTLSCTFSVYKANSNVTKMRIDFLDLELTGPTNGTCTDERLVISGQNTNNQVPVICGYNTGQHVYVDVSSLSGPLQLSVLASMTSSKRFKIRVCQFEDSCSEPSSNCLQYYTGVTGVISSFNYDQASMFSRSVPGYFNNLNYAICIRREEGYCSISYRNVVNGVEYPFQLTNVDDSGNPILDAGQAGADISNCPDDYIVIGNTRLCGDKFNDATVDGDFTMNAVVTDTGAGPIVIPVRTDAAVTGLGFKLFYTQVPCLNGY